MRSEVKEKELIIYPEGQIDTSNAEAVGQEISDITQANQGLDLVMDAEELKYISSAGLRQILKLKKAHPEFKIINANNELYDIFEMTGFTEMMDIEKAYRRMSVDGCEVIGEGSNGIVYRLNPDTIIKVYKNSDAINDIKRERELARTAFVMGINTAISYDVVLVGDKYGSVFEMIDSKSITKLITSDPEHKDEYIDIFVKLLKEIHATQVKEGLLPHIKPTALAWAEYLKGHIDDGHYEKLCRLIEEVPESDHMIHGDYHSNNVHYNKNTGDAILIDMDTIAVGNPVFEFACIYNAYQGFGIADKSAVYDFLKMDYDTACYVWQQTVKRYFGIDDHTPIENKAKVVGLARVLRRTIKREPDNTVLIEKSREELLKAIDAVDSIVL